MHMPYGYTTIWFAAAPSFKDARPASTPTLPHHTPPLYNDVIIQTALDDSTENFHIDIGIEDVLRDGNG